MKRIFLFIGVVFIALVTTAQEYIYIIEKDSHYLQEKVAVAVNDVDSISFVAPSECMENGYEWVDLGLSVKWATCNVGATTPEEYGNYYAWGETTTKSTYNSSTYTYTSNPSTLPLNKDAASVNMGGSWRMPTEPEQDELQNKCTWEWTTQNSVKGYLVTSKTNGNSIFLPAAGYRYSSDLYSAGSNGGYWSSSLGTYNSDGAYDLGFNSDGVNWDFDYRYCGHSVRGVCP